MAAAQRADVATRAAALPGLSVQDFSDDMMSLIAAADVVVAMGGYNTVCEVLTSRRRAVIVPRVRPGQEQCIRAERMAALDLLRMLHPDRLSPAALMSVVMAELDAVRRAEPLPALHALDGLAGSTRELLGLLGLQPRDIHIARPAAAEPHAVPRAHAQRAMHHGHETQLAS
jgi:predicted glycosyltransferase